MPELPEVEQFKQYFAQKALHQTIQNVEVKNMLVLDQISSSELRDQLIGREFEAIERHGKYLFAKLIDIWLVLHFGMSGYLDYIHKTDEILPHDRVIFAFTNHFQLIFHCQRMFGRIGLTPSIKDFIQQKNLGPDALQVDYDTFFARFNGRRGIIKNSLMNQAIIAGIGNLYADEVLFQTGIHPTTPITTLTEIHLQQIFNTMKEILTTAVELKADFERYPKSYLLHHRSKGNNCPKDFTPLSQIKISGRTAYFCPQHQKLHQKEN